MKRTSSVAAVIVVAWQLSVHATWSVIAVDGRLKLVAIASATCVPQQALERFPARDLRDVQAIVVPGKGVAAAQAAVDRTRANQNLIFQQLQKGTAPARILEMLRADPAFETRQFGIVDMQGRIAGSSGSKNLPVSLGWWGRVPATDIYYAIQGNILASEAVVDDAMKAFANASGELTDRVMAAMEAANARGGDKRCTCETAPKVDAPCDGKTAHVAYILLASPTDPTGASREDVVPALYISVTDRDISRQENADPVKTLRMRYDRWKQQRGTPRGRN